MRQTQGTATVTGRFVFPSRGAWPRPLIHGLLLRVTTTVSRESPRRELTIVA
jgi:hypothetical protein